MMDETILTDTCEMQTLLEYFKKHLRLTTDDADADLLSKLRSAMTSVGHDVNRVLTGSIVTATATVTSNGGIIGLTLRGPVRSISQVSVNGVAIEEGETGWSIIGNKLTIHGDYNNALIQIVYRAGYETMPPDMWEAVCLRGAGSFANPIDTVLERQRASDLLLRPYHYKEWQS